MSGWLGWLAGSVGWMGGWLDRQLMISSGGKN